MLDPASAPRPDQASPLLQAIGITKRYGDFLANDGVNFAVCPAKSTRCWARTAPASRPWSRSSTAPLQPTAGEIRWKGRRCDRQPAAARALGIGMVFQHFSLFEALTVTENIALALAASPCVAALPEPSSRSRPIMGCRSGRMRIVADLSVGERQRIEIVRCLLQ